MKPLYHLIPQDIRHKNGHLILSAQLTGHEAGESDLWFRVPEAYESAVTTTCDPFVLAVLFYLLKTHADLYVHGAVSFSLLRNLEEFQSAWVCWRPTWYVKAAIAAEQEPDGTATAVRGRAKSLLAFSGGADSCFTAWRHYQGRCGRIRRRIDAGVMVHGFDIGLDEPDVFENAVAKSRAMAQSIDMDLIPVATNQTFLGAHWGDSHGAAVASCLALFKNGFENALIASSSPYSHMHFPWGSNPITDWMLGTDDFPIVHDGAAYIRREKIRLIADWKEAMNNLRVCWQGDQHDKNCGLCEKCIRTILSFRVVDLPVPPCFNQIPDDACIASTTGLRPEALYHLEDILDHAKERRITESWVDALKKCVQHNQHLARREEESLLDQVRRKAAIRTRLRNLTESLHHGHEE